MLNSSDLEIHTICKRVNELLEAIIECHNSFSEQYLNHLNSKNIIKLNLKKVLVKDIAEFDDIVFCFLPKYYDYIQGYMYLLNDLTATIDFEYDYFDFDCRTRVKQNESMVNKIIYYCVGKNEEGKVSLNKCLNDLFGLRIMIGNYDLEKIYEKMCYYIDELKKNYKYKLKISDASKKCYSAIHIYIYGRENDNCSFPWELQIWNLKDKTANEECHKKYKQQYTEWAKLFNTTGIKEKGV